LEGQAPQNFPVLTTAITDDSGIRIRGTLNTGPQGVWRIEFFASPTCDPSGRGEGKTFLGSTEVTTGGSCNAAFDVTLPTTVPVGESITATATDQSTSEFSPCIPVEAAESLAVVNRMVSLISITTTTSTAEVFGGLAGTMTIRAIFKNTSTTRIETPFFVVTELSDRYFLVNADGGGFGGRLTPNVGADRVLAPGESFTTEFVIGLDSPNRFRFFVDLWGKPIQ
jgi:hypothetical protein